MSAEFWDSFIIFLFFFSLFFKVFWGGWGTEREREREREREAGGGGWSASSKINPLQLHPGCCETMCACLINLYFGWIHGHRMTVSIYK